MDIFKDEHHGGYQVRTKNEAFFIVFDHPEKETIFFKIVEVLKKEKGKDYPFSDMKKRLLASGFPEPLVIDVLNNCAEQGLFPSFAAYFDKTAVPVAEQMFSFPETAPLGLSEIVWQTLPEKSVAVLSEHKVFAEALRQQLKPYPYKKIIYKKYKDFPKEETQKAIAAWLDKEAVDFVVADAHCWSPYFLECFNEAALKRQLPWLLVGGVESGHIKWGPLFYGKETGCLCCLQDRIKSQHPYPSFLQAYEYHLREHKKSATPDYNYHVGVYMPLLVQWVVLELCAFFEWRFPIPSWRTLHTFNTQTYELKKHMLLKQPYCSVCKPALNYSLSPWLEGLAQTAHQ